MEEQSEESDEIFGFLFLFLRGMEMVRRGNESGEAGAVLPGKDGAPGAAPDANQPEKESDEMENVNAWIEKIDGWVWGLPLIAMILILGILLTVRLRAVQIREMPNAFRFMRSSGDGAAGEVSSFAALCTALSATVGTGNIVGVATAISVGGPGALFWMILTACFGMATKYSEATLAVKYRDVDEDGHVLGGTFYYIERGMRERFHISFRWLAKLFAFFGAAAGLLGIGTMTQINGITSAVQDFADPQQAHTITIFGMKYTCALVITAVVVTALTALVIVGGIRRISSVAQVVVPFMFVVYVACGIYLLIYNAGRLPEAFGAIFSGAFRGTAAVGGFAGAAVSAAIQKGISRGIFSNEAGLGSAPIAAAAGQVDWAAQQGLVSMLGTFFDTIIICNITGLCIIASDAWKVPGLEGVQITADAFRKGFFFAPRVGEFIIMACLVLFAFTTILGWNYYGSRCVEYLCNKNMGAVKVYGWLWVLAVLAGPFLTVSAVWNIADILNGLMAFPNLIALFCLSGVVARETDKFLDHMRKHPVK
ncbi:Amino-acid carrier protein AlsT [Caprobacter fermentans]|uniref:Amino-acid carrier protein AlsT n=2 Tax=Caproicibacter fermentans TaxID=2576756 RepID=A0A6N8HZ18_9FIRM|nr:Amino-acid carrier protein AlsT [Caproicibacter fermentans]